jgi:hypothetical protein
MKDETPNKQFHGVPKFKKSYLTPQHHLEEREG